MKQENMLPVNAFYLTALRDKRSRGRTTAHWTDKGTGKIKSRDYLDSIDLIIYIMLLSRADKDSFTCFPSIETICNDCGGIDRRVVWKHLQMLEQMQVIDIIKNKGRPNTYYMKDFAMWVKNPHY